MTTEDSNDWQSWMEANITRINKTLQQTCLQNADWDCVNIILSILNPLNSAFEWFPFSPSCESHCKQSSNMKWTHSIKPTSPNNFSGEHVTGHAFLNSCKLNLNLAPHQFNDDQAKIMWVMSFTKSRQTAYFINQHMYSYQAIGNLSYEL